MVDPNLVPVVQAEQTNSVASEALAQVAHPEAFKLASVQLAPGLSEVEPPPAAAGASSHPFSAALHYLPVSHFGSQAVHSYLKYTAASEPEAAL